MTTTEQSQIEITANEIVNHFFILGARVGKSDYDFVLDLLKNKV